MRTMQPAIMLGSYVWAQDRLPADEFGIRLDELRAAMAQHDWAAMLVYGDVREHAALGYLTNYIPRIRWGLALIPRDGEPRLLCAMGTRDLPAMRAMTWIADVQSGWGPEWLNAFDPWLARLPAERRSEIGTLGCDHMASALHETLLQSLDTRFTLRRADDMLAVPPPRKRPRELTMLRQSCKLLEETAKAFVASARANGAPETAALDAERVARSLAAQDVRTLVSLDGGRTLLPYQGRFDKTAGPLVGYLAVKVLGYWADLFVTAEDRNSAARAHAEQALDALIARMRPGARAGDLHAAAMAALAPLRLHPALGGSVGHGIGLSLDEQPQFRADADAMLVEDGVYSLQVGVADADAGHALVSALVRTASKGTDVLLRSSGIATS
ncbi:MAG TPA: M24 family metallopeptidase [Xanthobacteraceae bacterium]|jgi:Xaa-Pro aminopeptidase|nr:M24 family metallopeptidase [Xanthobacteraceae bacterium]